MGRRNFSEKVIVIAGAACPFGEALAVSLANKRATVVLLDPDEAPLLKTARTAPGLIEPLPVKLDSSGAVATLGRIWGAEPLAALVQLQPLVLSGRPGSAVKSMLLLAEALSPGLQAGRGAVLNVLPAAGPDAHPVRQSTEAAQLRMCAVLPGQLGPRGIRSNTLCLPPDMDTAEALPPALFLIHPEAATIHGETLRLVRPPGGAPGPGAPG